jgi:hypothetical protein
MSDTTGSEPRQLNEAEFTELLRQQTLVGGLAALGGVRGAVVQMSRYTGKRVPVADVLALLDALAASNTRKLPPELAARLSEDLPKEP